jgi:hypothetical protein
MSAMQHVFLRARSIDGPLCEFAEHLESCHRLRVVIDTNLPNSTDKAPLRHPECPWCIYKIHGLSLMRGSSGIHLLSAKLSITQFFMQDRSIPGGFNLIA